MQALPLFRGLECLLAIAFDVRVGSDIIARMEGREEGKGRTALAPESDGSTRVDTTEVHFIQACVPESAFCARE